MPQYVVDTEARRVLRPGGRFVFSVWDRIEENAFADDVTQAVATAFPHDPPRFLSRTPHGYHDVALIRADLGRAGFGDIAIETRQNLSHAPSARDVATAYCQGTPLRSEIEARDASLLQLATDRATRSDRQPPWRRRCGRQNPGACDRGNGLAKSRSPRQRLHS